MGNCLGAANKNIVKSIKIQDQQDGTSAKSNLPQIRVSKRQMKQDMDAHSPLENSPCSIVSNKLDHLDSSPTKSPAHAGVPDILQSSCKHLKIKSETHLGQPFTSSKQDGVLLHSSQKLVNIKGAKGVQRRRCSVIHYKEIQPQQSELQTARPQPSRKMDSAKFQNVTGIFNGPSKMTVRLISSERSHEPRGRQSCQLGKAKGSQDCMNAFQQHSPSQLPSIGSRRQLRIRLPPIQKDVQAEIPKKKLAEQRLLHSRLPLESKDFFSTKEDRGKHSNLEPLPGTTPHFGTSHNDSGVVSIRFGELSARFNTFCPVKGDSPVHQVRPASD